MSNYVKSTNFAVKDTLITGDPDKKIKGTEIDSEYNNIATAVNSKANTASPTLTGTPLAPTASSGTNTTQIATTAFVQANKSLILDAVYPVGSIYINAISSTNPNTLLGFGTWAAFGAGRVPVGFDAADPLFDSAEETGGSKDAIVVSHNHTASSSVSDPGHRHEFRGGNAGGSPGTYYQASSGQPGPGYSYSGDGSILSSTTGITVSTDVNSTGSSGTNTNLQPYITVYMWKRTA